jgi:hypothetical protein
MSAPRFDPADLDRLRGQEVLRAIVADRVKLKRVGKTLVGLCPFHTEKTPSFTLFDDGGFKCFGCGAHGDVFEYVKLRDRVDFPHAAETVAAEYGIAIGKPKKRTNGKDGAHSSEKTWHPIVPRPDMPPPTEEQFVHKRFGSPTDRFEYVTPEGRRWFYQRRFDHADGSKEFAQLTHGVLNGKSGWHPKGPAQPYPLYRLDRIMAADPSSTVLVVEGEKACHAAERLFPDKVVTTWLNGANSVHVTDWSPLWRFQEANLIWWPDADRPRPDGSPHGCFIATPAFRKLFPRARWVDTAGLEEIKDGYDAADLERGHCDDPDAWLQARLRDSAPEPAPEPQLAIPRTIALARFLQLAKPPEFLVDRVIQRGRLHTLTARTFHGKTTTMCYLMLSVSNDAMQFAGLDTQQGRVVLLAGENPDDTAAKLQVACDYWHLNPATLTIDIIPGAFDLAGNIDAALAEIAKGGPAALIVPDTSAAYRVDSDEDDNQASKLWAQNLRRLVELSGRPTVISPTHPTKNADRNSLLPRGGSGFLNEVDSNLALWCDDIFAARPIIELHWQGKHRGPNFSPIRLEMIDQPHPTFTFHDGTPLPLKVATPATRPPSAFEGLDHTTMARIFARLREEPAPGMCWSPDKRARYRAIDVIAAEARKTPEQAEAILAVWRKNEVITEGDYWAKNGNRAKRIILNERLIAAMLMSERS